MDVLKMGITSPMEYVFSCDLLSHIFNVGNILIESLTFRDEKPSEWPGVSGNCDPVSPRIVYFG